MKTTNILDVTGMIFYNYQLSSVSTYCNYAKYVSVTAENANVI